jgi:CheY-like chemotaxis protein
VAGTASIAAPIDMKPEQPQAPINILLADDDTDDCYFLKEALVEFSLPTHLTTVHDGEQLMEQLTKETNELPHVLFLDLNMPRKNGFECLLAIKNNKNLKNLPVIIYSTSFHYRIAEILYKSGATYYISKPAEISELKKTVRQIITDIAEGNISQPPKENFVLTSERKNYQKLSWFNNFFTIPFTETFKQLP